MADLGIVGNTEASEQFVGTAEPRTLSITLLEPSDDLPHIEPAYTHIEFVKDFDNLTIVVISDTAPTVIQVNSFITSMIRANSYITDILKVSSEIQEEE